MGSYQILSEIPVSKYYYDLGYEEVYLVSDETYFVRDFLKDFREKQRDKWMFVCPFLDRMSDYGEKYNFYKKDHTDWVGGEEAEKTTCRLRQSVIIYNREFINDIYLKF